MVRPNPVQVNAFFDDQWARLVMLPIVATTRTSWLATNQRVWLLIRSLILASSGASIASGHTEDANPLGNLQQRIRLALLARAP
jgi:hypothetical protein